MTDLESPKKNNDCYFYYYSTCAKGDHCTFRHEPSALGCETMCAYWKEGKCLNIHCNFRHMELRKNRKVIPCYWESQPIGCLKAHCPFMHQNPRPSLEGSEKCNISTENTIADNMLNDKLNQQSERKVTAVDSLVVNFEEESDNESGPTFSPIKNGNRIVKVKTLEEIKLEKIQAESAAYYSYYDNQQCSQNPSIGEDMRQRIVQRMIINNAVPERKVTVQNVYQPRHQEIRKNKRLSDDELANILGDDSLRKKQKLVYQNEDGNFKVMLSKTPCENEMSVTINDNTVNKRIVKQKPMQENKNIENIKVKTLDEIRAERNSKKVCEDNVLSQMEKDEAEVTSTSMEETTQESDQVRKQLQISGMKKIKLRRNLPISENIMSSNTVDDSSNFGVIERYTEEVSLKDNLVEDKLLGDFTMGDPIKTLDEVLLLDADDDEYDITLKAEEDLLNEVDDF